MSERRRGSDFTRYISKYLGAHSSVSQCNDCGALTTAPHIHDKFHDDYKPSRKATFIVEHENGTKTLQFIDGSTVTIDNAESLSDDVIRGFLNDTNERLAPFYEGGETSLKWAGDHSV